MKKKQYLCIVKLKTNAFNILRIRKISQKFTNYKQQKKRPNMVTKVYKNVQGTWLCVSGESETLAETLRRLGIIIDDNCQFCRIIQYEQNRIITYRAYTCAKVEITISRMQ